MGLLVFTYRKQDLIRRKLDAEFKLLQLTQKLSSLTDYASSIADGVVSLNDLMHAPPSMFNRMSMFMMYSHAASMAGATEKYNFMAMNPNMMPQLQNPQMQQQYADMMFKNLYDQEREKFKKIEEDILNRQEKQISQEKAKLETQLTMIQKELESVEKAEGEAAKSFAPKFGLG